MTHYLLKCFLFSLSWNIPHDSAAGGLQGGYIELSGECSGAVQWRSAVVQCFVMLTAVLLLTAYLVLLLVCSCQSLRGDDDM